MGNNTLSYKGSTTYLGLILGSKLTWDLQIKETKKKITKYCSIFRKVRHFLSKTCRLQLYNAFIFSRLNYRIEIYLNKTKGYNSQQYKAGFYTVRIFGRIFIYLAFCVINS